MTYGCKGIDISKWNTINDANKVKAAGIDFVLIREGHGTSTDANFFANVSKFINAGISVAGVYHFSYAMSESDAVEEAKLCVKNLKAIGIGPRDDFTVFYDFEYDTVKQVAKAGVNLTKKECNLFALAFCEEIKRSGYNAGVYFNYDYYKNWYDSSVLNKYTRWYARWGGDCLLGCTFHQYTNKGSIPGIIGDVDMNYYYGEDIDAKVEREHLRWENLEIAFTDCAKILNVLGYSLEELHGLMERTIQNGSL